MEWGSYERLRSRDVALDALRNRIAELSVGGQPEGLISTRVETQWAGSTGRLWWRAWTGPREVLVYEISWIDEGSPYPYDDGVADPDEPIVSELLAGRVTLYGYSFEIRWLSGKELADAEVEMGIADHWADAKDHLAD